MMFTTLPEEEGLTLTGLTGGQKIYLPDKFLHETHVDTDTFPERRMLPRSHTLDHRLLKEMQKYKGLMKGNAIE